MKPALPAGGPLAPPVQPIVFRNFGGIHQMVIAGAEDLARIHELDAARWAATSAPLADLRCDPALRPFLDPAGTGRLRVSQLVSARDWLFSRLARRGHLAERTETLILEDLDPGDAGAKLKHAAGHVLALLQVEKRDRLQLADLRRFRDSYKKLLANGDGIVPPEVVPEPDVAAYVKDVLATVGGRPDASGLQGVGRDELAKFEAQGRAWLEWTRRPAKEPALLPWGADTEGAAKLVDKLAPKLDEYFLQCELLRQEGRSADDLRVAAEELRKLRESPELEKRLAGAPIATPTPSGRLALDEEVNALHREDFQALVTRVLHRVLGPKAVELTREDWKQVVAVFEPWRAWQKQKPPEPFEKLGEAALEKHLGGELRARTEGFIATDDAARAEVEQLVDLEKVLLLQRWLVEIANNFVNFSAIYNPKEQALVDNGSLVIDGRRLDFCVKVADRAAHKKVAAESALFLVYASISEQDGKGAGWEIVAPVTSGERGRLRTGKRGIFVDTTGKEYDAVVVEIAEAAISVKEAMMAPFRRVQQFVAKRVEGLVESQLAAREKAMTEKTGAVVDTTAAAVAAPKPAAPAAPAPAAGGSNLQSMILVGSVAAAALGSTLAFVASINPLKMLGAIAGVAAAVALLSGLLGWMKLRRRDMGPVLEANGWAINVQMRLTRRLGKLFTHVPAYPPGTQIQRLDVLAGLDEQTPEERGAARKRLVVLLAVLAFVLAAAVVSWMWAGWLPTP